MYSTVPPWLPPHRRAAHWRGNGRTRHGISAHTAQERYESGRHPEAFHQTAPSLRILPARVSPSRLFTHTLAQIPKKSIPNTKPKRKINWCLSLRSSGQLTVESGQLWYPLWGLFEIIAIIITANYSENRNICELNI